MKASEFNKIVNQVCNTIKDTLCTKAEEYALGSDRLEAFKRAGQMLNTDSANALLGMLNKHVMSVYMMVQDKGHFGNQRWAEKIIDIMNYMILLFAIKLEENQYA